MKEILYLILVCWVNGLLLMARAADGGETNYTFGTLAGLAGSKGSADGTGSAARFSSPYGVAVDASGNVYVADIGNHTIRQITSAGVVSTLAGSAGSSGSADGTGSTARFWGPGGVAVDTSGNVYVADYYTIRKITAGGTVTTLAGLAGYENRGSSDGMGSAARFYGAPSVAVDNGGNVYVADEWNHTIRKITSGGVVSTLAGLAGSKGSADGAGAEARFNHPTGVAADSSGNVYVADWSNSTIRKITPSGVVSTLAGDANNRDPWGNQTGGSADGLGSTARFRNPTGVAVDSSGNVYVADRNNHTIRKITPAGVVSTLAGLAGISGYEVGTGSAARFIGPQSVAVDSRGNVYVADTGSHTIRKSGTVMDLLAQALDTTNLVWATGGNASWLALTLGAHDGADVAQSGTIAQNQETWLETTVMGPGLLTFWWRVSSQGNSDFLRFYLGELEEASLSGEMGWQPQAFAVSPGEQRLRWKYVRSGGWSGGQDRGWVDEVVFQASTNWPPVVLTPPVSQTVVEGATVTLSVVAAGSAPMNCQWRKDGINLLDATNAVLVLHNVATNQAGLYSVVVGNTVGSVTSTNATLSVLTLAYVLAQAVDTANSVWITGGDASWLAVSAGAHDYSDVAQSGSVAHGQESWLETTVTGPGLLTFWWRVSSQTNSDFLRFYIGGEEQTDLSGETDWQPKAFALSPGVQSLRWQYMKDVSGADGQDRGWVDQVVFKAGTNWAPLIVRPPGNQSASAGATVTFSVVVAGTPPLDYQWRKDGTDLVGATNASLVLSNVTVEQSGTYNVVVTNVAGSAASLAGLLSVYQYEPYTFTTLAGLAGNSGSADGMGSAARFNCPAGAAVDSTGNVYVAEWGNHTIRKITPGGVVSTLAGKAGSPGSADGTGSAARFGGPVGVAVDSDGNVYVTDSGNCTIRKVTPEGAVSTLAGLAQSSGATDGKGSAARFDHPEDVAVDSSGNVYVADSMNHTLRKVTPEGVVSTLAGKAGLSGSSDGTGSTARFHYPGAVAVDGSGNVYVADRMNLTIRKITLDGVVSTPAGRAGSSGSADGTGSAARFCRPSDVAVDGSGNVYVADGMNHTIRKITPSGEVSTLAGLAGSSGSADGTGSAVRFNYPCGVAVDSSGNAYIADYENNTIRKGVPSFGPSVTVQPQSQTVLSRTNATLGVAATGMAPLSYQWQKNGTNLVGATTGTLTLTNVQVADAGKYRVGVNNLLGSVWSAEAVLTVLPIQYLTNPVTVSVLAGAGTPGYADGAGRSGQFCYPNGGCVDANGNVYVADFQNHRIRKITPEGVVTTLAGNGVAGYVDGPANQARFNQPLGVCVGFQGNVFVADTGNNRIRRTTAVGVVSTIAGSGVAGYLDRTGTAAQFNFPNDLVVDALGNLYVTEFNNHTVRKIAPDGTVSTWVGNGTAGYADGPRASARLNQPGGIALDRNGNLFLTEWGGHRIRKISSSGEVSTVAGDGTAGWVDGPGSQARFRNPDGIVADTEGNLFIADNGNHVIRRVNAVGWVETVAGTGVAGYADGAGRTAQFSSPSGIGLDANGALYAADWGNHQVRKIVFVKPVEITVQPQGQTVTTGATAVLSVAAMGTAPLSYQWQKDGVGLSGGTNAVLTLTNVSEADAGAYAVQVSNIVGSVTSVGAVLSVRSPPVTTGLPQSRTVNLGASVTMTVSATGTAPLSYQWRKDGVDISEATGSSLTLGSVGEADAGTYTVQVSNVAGSVESVGAVLSVISPPVITSQPQSQAVNLGTSGTFTVSATGTAPLSYQWRKDGVDIGGATGWSLDFESVSEADAGIYTVQVGNVVGSVGSVGAVLSVTSPPLIMVQPQSQSVTAGSTAILSIAVTGTAPLSYQWQKNGVNLADDDRLSGVNSATLTITSAQTTDSGNYAVMVRNSFGAVTSSSVLLTVNPLPELKLTIHLIGNEIVLSWGDPAATLEEADSVTGPWKAVVGDSSSPRVLTISAGPRFYRLRR